MDIQVAKRYKTALYHSYGVFVNILDCFFHTNEFIHLPENKVIFACETSYGKKFLLPEDKLSRFTM